MQKERKDKHFIKKPIYEGGPKAMKQFVKDNLKYPKEALENKIEGTVALTYTIDYQGNVIDVKIITSLGHGCDEEAIRLVKSFKFTVPKNRKLKVKFHKNIQIHFRLPKEKSTTKTTTSSVQYNYVSSQAPAQSTEKKPQENKGYSYTINFNY